MVARGGQGELAAGPPRLGGEGARGGAGARRQPALGARESLGCGRPSRALPVQSRCGCGGLDLLCRQGPVAGEGRWREPSPGPPFLACFGGSVPGAAGLGTRWSGTSGPRFAERLPPRGPSGPDLPARRGSLLVLEPPGEPRQPRRARSGLEEPPRDRPVALTPTGVHQAPPPNSVPETRNEGEDRVRCEGLLATAFKVLQPLSEGRFLFMLGSVSLFNLFF